MLCTYRSDLWRSAAYYENLYLHPLLAIKTAEHLAKNEVKKSGIEHDVSLARESAKYALQDIHGFMQTASHPEIKDKHPEYLEARDIFHRIKPYIKKAGYNALAQDDIGKCDSDLERLKEIMRGKADAMWSKARSL